MASRRKRGFGESALALAIAGLIFGLSQYFANMPELRGLETETLDLRFQLRGPIAPEPDVALVMVDDRSLAALGRWPLSRTLLADAVGRLDRLGAKAIVFDMLFPEPEQAIPPWVRETAAEALTGRSLSARVRAQLRAVVADDPDTDFARAIASSGKVLLPLSFTFRGPEQDPPYDLSDSGYQTFDSSPATPIFTLAPKAATVPIAVLGNAAAGLGHVSMINDQDGVPRYDYVAFPFEGDFIPSMPVRAAAAYLGVAWPQVGLGLGQGVRFGSLTVLTGRHMRLLINCLGPKGTVPTYSFIDLLNGAVPASAVNGRAVLIGGSFTGNSDSYPSPFGGELLPGTERLADAIDTIVSRRFIVEGSPAALGFSAAVVLALAGWMARAIAALPTRLSPLPGLTALAIWGAIAQIAFVKGLWLPVVGPFAALAMTAISTVVYRYGVVDREGRRVRATFRQYMAPELVDVLAAHPERLRLGGETRCMTFMFCDIRGFTGISERLKSDPQALIQLINGFLSPMTEVIMARRGTIDKYMGDCIMAFWNAPLDDPQHADHACESALAMVTALELLNEIAEAELEPDNRSPTLQIGIGINSGECVVGNMGSSRRFDYSVLGDAVNLASRLEALSKLYGVTIVMGEETRALSSERAILELDVVAVKGKDEPVCIYTLLGDSGLARSAAFQALAQAHGTMLAAYRRQDWVAADGLIATCRGLWPDLEQLYRLYQLRIDRFIVDPPPAEWNGVFVATSK